MNTEIKKQLEQLALNRSTPFCYSCYREAKSGLCKSCGSDDLMRITKDNGPEYGLEWIIKSILETELTPIDLDEEFENFMRECYPETVTVGWMDFDAVRVMKELDPLSWEMAQSEWASQEEGEGNFISLDGGANYYRRDEIEDLAEEAL